jgi:hypothetical protein
MGLLNGLSAYYKMDEGSGNWLDAHIHGLDVTDADSPGAGSGTGILNGDRTLLGSANSPPFARAQVTSPLFNPYGGITVAGWAKINDTAYFGNDIIEVDGNGNFAFAINFDDDGSGNPCATLADSVSNPVSGTLSTGTWYFVAGRWSEGVESTLRVNATDYAGSGTNTGTNGNGLILFGSGAGPDFEVDEWGVWQRLLSDAELDTLYGSGTPPGYDSFTFDSPPSRLSPPPFHRARRFWRCRYAA